MERKSGEGQAPVLIYPIKNQGRCKTRPGSPYLPMDYAVREAFLVRSPPT